MRVLPRSFKPLILVTSIALASCGGSSDSGSGGTTASKTISGTAAAGAAIVGTVTVKGALGNTQSALIEADGTYDVDVTGLTAPYRLRAQGTVGGKTYKLHSYAEDADVGGTVNITPFTDLIVANAAQTIAENFFDSNVDTSLDPVEVEAQEEALQSKLQEVFDALGLGTAIDLLNDSFSADHTGLDAALDIISIEVDSATNIATITNLVENTTITDDVLDDSDNTETLTVNDENALTEAVSDTQAIVNQFESFAAEFTGGLPSSADLQDYFGSNFLSNDESRGQFLTDITTDPELIDLQFSSISISDLDSTAGTATVTFNVVFEGEVDPENEVWFVERDATLGWQLLGNQRIVDLNTLSYHCNDYNALDGNPGGCGINVSFWDENFNNNNTGGSPIASGTVKIIDGDNGTTVKDIIYLGTPDYVAPGEVQIYNASTDVNTQGYYTGDWRPFGSGLNEIDASIFTEGDIVEYNLYTQDLDVTDPTMPTVQMGTEVATYTSNILFEPSLTPLYPTATSASITAMQNFELGNNLTIAWTLAAGTLSDEVLVEISDSMGNRLEIWDESFSGSTTSITVASTELDSAAAQSAGLDQNAETYELRVRIYAYDQLTYQSHSLDYVFTIDGPAAGGSGTPPLAFSQPEITSTTFYASFLNDEIASCGLNTWIVESFDHNSSNYTLTFCDNSTETGTYQIINGDLIWTAQGGGTDAHRRLSYDETIQGWIICTTETQQELDSCGVQDQYYLFDDLSNAQAFAAQQNGSGSSLSCNFESPWNDITGQPDPFNSFDDFETVVADCGGALTTVSNDMVGTWTDTWTEGMTTYVETVVFNANGTGTFTETENGTPIDSATFNWSISNNYITITDGSTFLDVWARTASNITAYTEEDNWGSDLSVSTTSTLDGEIWWSNYTKQ